jgi:hypothetical protein
MFYSIPVTLVRCAAFPFFYGLALLGLGLYSLDFLAEPPTEISGVVSSLAQWFVWLNRIFLFVGPLLIVIALRRAFMFRFHALRQRAEFEELVANKETMVNSENRDSFAVFSAMMAYEYELERSFYDRSIWRQQLLALASAGLKIICVLLVFMTLSNILIDDWIPGLAMGLPCIVPWLILGRSRPMNLFTLRARQSGHIAYEELAPN